MNENPSRRDFLGQSTATAAGVFLTQNLTHSASAQNDGRARPNILWITSEDNGPQLGAYGDPFADTPNLDALAAKGLIYRNAWSNAPVCAPARTTIISGVYPPCTGSEHMRSMTRLPAHMKMFPELLREAGYFCTNNHKEDYNLEKSGEVWDDSSRNAHWRARPAGQPFFAVFNYTVSHESQIRKRPHTPVHDPGEVRVPAYHPDTPEVRRDWAQYYDKVTEMDTQIQQVLDDLEADGLAEETIVFYYGDHGSGMPRSKRWPYNSGLSVPLIVYFPEKWKHLASEDYAPGGETERLVGFIDLAPTVLSLAGIQPPPTMQGEAFHGRHGTTPKEFAFGFRGRMDERYDLVRSVRDKRYIYIRNYMPYRIYGQYLNYMFQTPTTRVWREMYDRGDLRPPQTYFWETKPSEELYDLQNDPDEVNNLAGSSEYKTIENRLRVALRENTLRIRDVGFLPEYEIHERAKGSTPYEMGHDDSKYPLERILSAAEQASELPPNAQRVRDRIQENLKDTDSAVRYWAVTEILIRGAECAVEAQEELQQALDDPAPNVRITAAEVLGRYGDESARDRALPVLLELARLDRHGIYVSVAALNALDAIENLPVDAIETVAALPKEDTPVHPRMRNYVPRLIERILERTQQ